MSRIRLRASLAILPTLALGAAGAGAESTVPALRTKIEKWVETTQIASQEKSEWDAERETLKATQKLLRQQKEALQAEIAELEASNTATDEERRDLLLRRGEYQRGGRALADEIREMEEAVLALVPRLPGPLLAKLEPLLIQIPEDPETTRLQLGQRLMNVLGVLAQTEKWNGTTTLVGETRAVTSEQKVHVRTLYWGLGQAIYVDARGETAGIGRPGPDGWAFSAEPELAGSAVRLLDIAEGNVDVIDFVPLPVRIQ